MTTLLIYRDGQYFQATEAEVQSALQALGAAPLLHSHTAEQIGAAPAAHTHALLMTQAERDQLTALPGKLDGKADLGLDGKLKASQLPASALVDIKATGMMLAAGVLTMTQDNGGPSATVDLNSFATDAEVSAALAGMATPAGRAMMMAPDVEAQRIALGVNQVAVTPGISADALQALSLGSDGKPYLSMQALGGQVSNDGPAPWTLTPIGNVIPLDGVRYMPARTVSAPISLSPGQNPVAGGSCYQRLIADATNIPQFPGFVVDPSSDGWAPISGTVHIARFWHDGTASYYSLQQLVDPPLIVPILGAVEVNPSGLPIISLTYSTTLSSVPPPESAYSIESSVGPTTVMAASVSGPSIMLTISRVPNVGEVMAVSYVVPSNNPVKSPSGGAALPFSGKSVANSLSFDDRITFSVLSGFAAQTGADGYEILTSTIGTWGSKVAGNSLMLTLNPEKEQYFEVTVGGLMVGAGLHASKGTATNTTSTYFFYGHSASGYWRQSNSNMTMLNAAAPAAANDIVRFRLTPSNILYFEVSKDNRSTWVTVASKVITDLTLHPRVGASDINSTVRSVRCNGVAAV